MVPANSNAVHGRPMQLPEGAVSLHPALAAGWFETAVAKGRGGAGGEALNRLRPPVTHHHHPPPLSSHLHRLILAAASGCSICTHSGRCRMRFCPCSCQQEDDRAGGERSTLLPLYREGPHLLVAQSPALVRHCRLCGCPQPTRATRFGAVTAYLDADSAAVVGFKRDRNALKL